MRITFAIIIVLAISARVAAFEEHSIDVSLERGRYYITAEIFIAAPVDTTFSALTNYNNLGDIVPGVRVSRHLGSDQAISDLVYVEKRQCFIICRTMESVERVTYPAIGEILSTIVPAKSDFNFGWSRWQLISEGVGTVIKYSAEMEPKFWVPPFIGTKILKISLRRQIRLTGIRIEKLAQPQAD